QAGPRIDLLAVGFVVEERPPVPLEAVVVPGGWICLDVDKREPGSVASAVGSFENDGVPNDAGVDLAQEGVEVLSGRKPIDAVGPCLGFAQVLAANARFVGDRLTLDRFYADDRGRVA